MLIGGDWLTDALSADSTQVPWEPRIGSSLDRCEGKSLVKQWVLKRSVGEEAVLGRLKVRRCKNLAQCCFTVANAVRRNRSSGRACFLDSPSHPGPTPAGGDRSFL